MHDPPPELRVITAAPHNAETPLEALLEARTPVPLFYIRNHFDVPRIDPRAWRLRVDGAVERPLDLSLEDLQRLPTATALLTLECAGNGRTALTPRPPGVPWGFGAVATAAFTGAPLAVVLEQAGVAADAVEVVFHGADAGPVGDGRSEAFVRSLPLDAARGADVLLAWVMNGEPLTADHGAPLRLVVPGWYGMASVKWLTRISAVREPFAGYFQARQYVYDGQAGLPDRTPVSRMRVRALIARPGEDAELPVGEEVTVAGVAWSGDGAVRFVEVSADGGSSWSRAALSEPPAPFAATPWTHRWKPMRAGACTLVARAADAAGHVQPLASVFNAQGYGNNVVHRVAVRVVE